MAIYYGNKGNRHFIMCPELKVCYAFNLFGTIESKEASISDCNNWVEVDFLSFAGVGMKSCEVLLNNEKALVNLPLLDCVSVIKNFGNYLGTIFTVSHEDSVGKFTQVIFVAHKGIFTKALLMEKFSTLNWNSLFS